jgi:hypothetical protein
MKNSNNTIGNRHRDLPTCSAVPQPTAPPAACPQSYDVDELNLRQLCCGKLQSRTELPSVDLHTAVSAKTLASLLKHVEFSELSCLIDFMYPAEQYISMEN